MLDGDEEPARAEVGRGDEVAHGGDGRERDATALRRRVEFLDRLIAAPLLEKDLQGVEVGPARQAAGEQLETRPLGVAHEVDEALPLVLLDGAEEDPTVAALHEAERLDRLLPEPRGDEARVGPELEGQLEDGGDAFLGRHLDVLAPPGRESGEQRAERADGGGEGRLEAGLVTEGLEGRQIRLTGRAVERRHAARAPRDHVGPAVAGVRPREPEGRDGGHHEPRVQRGEPGVVEAVRGHVLRVDVVHEEVGTGDQAVEDRAPARAGEVERDPALVGVQVEEEAALLRVRRAARKRPPLARAVAGDERLDLHHVGAEVGEQLGCIRGAHQLADLEDAEAVERARHRQSPSASRTSSSIVAGSSCGPSRVRSSVCECSPTGQS